MGAVVTPGAAVVSRANVFRDRRSRRGHHKALARVVSFLREVGIEVREGAAPRGCFLPGVWYDAGALCYDPRVAYVGDLIHDAGHMAILPARLRVYLGVGSVFKDPRFRAERRRIADDAFYASAFGEEDPLGYLSWSYADEEAAANAWTYAAAEATEVQVRRAFQAVTFFRPGQAEPVKGAGDLIARAIGWGRYPGIRGLAAAGMCDVEAFPAMKRWVQP